MNCALRITFPKAEQNFKTFLNLSTPYYFISFLKELNNHTFYITMQIKNKKIFYLKWPKILL